MTAHAFALSLLRLSRYSLFVSLKQDLLKRGASVMWQMLSVVGIAFQLGQIPKAGEIAREYDAITAVQVRAFAAAARDNDRGAGMQRSLEPLFRGLLDRAAQLPLETFDTRDLIALAESAERVRDLEVALRYARRAASRGDDLKAYITVVRCLCAAGHIDEAETAVREGGKIFPDGERRYLMHNILSHKYRGIKRHADAYNHMLLTIELLLPQVDTHPFYPLHLERCLDEASTMAEIESKTLELVQKAKEWHSSTRLRIDREREGAIRIDKEEPASLGRLKRIRLLSQAAVVFIRYCDGRVDSVLEQWLESLIGCEIMANGWPEWLGEVNAYLEIVSALMTSSFDGERIASQLDQAAAKLSQSSRTNTSDEKMRNGVKARLTEVRSSILQHCRHRQLVKRQWQSPEMVQMIKPDVGDSPLAVVYFFDPLSASAAKGLRSMELLRGRNRQFSHVPIIYAVFQSGLVFDAETRSLNRSKSATIEQELMALKDVKSILRIPTDVHLFENNTVDAQVLAPTTFPVTVLLDSHGTVLCILTGIEKQKSMDIARHVNRFSQEN